MTTIERRPNVVGVLFALAALVAGLVVWLVARSSGDSDGAPSATVAATSTTTRAATSTASPSISFTPTATIDLVLPSASGVVLFAHTADPNAVVRVEVDRGRVVATPVGSVLSTAPAFLAVGPSAAVVRPYDHVPGYVVADSGSVTDPSGLLDEGAFMACSDGRTDRIWLARESLLQVDYGGSLKAQVSGSGPRPWAIGCDGAGEMLYRRGTDTLVTGDGPPKLVTSATLVAAGPRTFLVNDCSAATACSLTVIDRPTGERRPLTVGFAVATPQSFPLLTDGRLGSISPDGRTAVLFRQPREVIFVDLESGTGRGISSIAGEFQSFVWSTDSRYLFYIGGGYKLYVFDRDTGNLKTLGVNNVFALAGRPS